MLGNRHFEKGYKTNYRKIWDKVSTLSLADIGAYIRGAYKAHLDLMSSGDRIDMVHEEYQPYIAYIEELESRDIDSTEKQLQLDRDLIVLRDCIAGDMHGAYEWDVYGQTRYEQSKILDYILEDKNPIVLIQDYPRLIWASSWNKDKENQKYYKLSQKILDLSD